MLFDVMNPLSAVIIGTGRTSIEHHARWTAHVPRMVPIDGIGFGAGDEAAKMPARELNLGKVLNVRCGAGVRLGGALPGNECTRRRA